MKTIEEKRNAGQEAYGSKPAEPAIREGIKVEAEHADLVAWLKQTLADTGVFPADEEIFAKIAEAHLTEDAEYYKKLAGVEAKNAYQPSVLKLPTGKYKLVGSIDTEYADKRYETEEEANKALAEMKMKGENKNAERAHTPITSQQQADFFGAELGRKKKGEQGETDMSIAELERHLREWGKKNEMVGIPEARRNEGTRLYGSSKRNSDIDDEIAELEDDLMDFNREYARTTNERDKDILSRQIQEIKTKLEGLRKYK